MSETVAIGAAALAGWLAPTAGPALHRLRSTTSPRVDARSGRPVVIVVGTVLVLVAAFAAGPVAATLGAFAAAVLRWRIGVRSRARAAATRRSRTVDACRVLSVTLRAGRTPAEALAAAAREQHEVAAASRAAAAGGNVAESLRDAARRPGGEGWDAVAAAWLVSDSSGASLADVVDRVVDVLHDRVTVAGEAEAELAAVQATAVVLALLPMFPLLLGTGLQGDPVGFLLGTAAGAACLTVGAALSVAGLWWVDRLGSGVTSSVVDRA